MYRKVVELESDLVYVSIANQPLASIPYLIALDHSTRHALAVRPAMQACCRSTWDAREHSSQGTTAQWVARMQTHAAGAVTYRA